MFGLKHTVRGDFSFFRLVVSRVLGVGHLGFAKAIFGWTGFGAFGRGHVVFEEVQKCESHGHSF